MLAKISDNTDKESLFRETFELSSGFPKMSKLFEYPSAVRGYYYYRKYWQPKESQTLDCVHEKGNPFDYFAIKVRFRF